MLFCFKKQMLADVKWINTHILTLLDHDQPRQPMRAGQSPTPQILKPTPTSC